MHCMLRTGIYLLSSSSMGVMYRCSDMPYAMMPELKWMCLAGLSVSLVCFVVTYMRIFHPVSAKDFHPGEHMIESPEWKTSH